MTDDLDALERLAKAATSGPWAWRWEDTSLQWLHGPREEFDHVLSVSPCKACQARAEDSAAKGKAICLGPSPANADYIAALHPQQVLALLARLRAAEQERDGKVQGLEIANRNVLETLTKAEAAGAAKDTEINRLTNELQAKCDAYARLWHKRETAEAERDALHKRVRTLEAALCAVLNAEPPA